MTDLFAEELEDATARAKIEAEQATHWAKLKDKIENYQCWSVIERFRIDELLRKISLV